MTMSHINLTAAVRGVLAIALTSAVLLFALPRAFAADASFTQFIASLWPEAQKAGVSRAVFDQETRGLEPDYKLPDLLLPGRPSTGAPSQAEFVQVPADYVKEASIARLAAEGQRLMIQQRATLAAIEQRFGVPGNIILAIWGRETDYGRHTLPYDGLRVLATQAYVGRRKDQYRGEFIEALKLIQSGDVTRKTLRTSWAGATGYDAIPAVGICTSTASTSTATAASTSGHSVPDALASAAQQLKSTRAGSRDVRWAYEVKRAAPMSIARMGVPEVTKPII